MAQRVPHQRVKAFLCGLWLTRNAPEHRAAVLRQCLQVQHLGTGLRQRCQQPRFARAGGAADHTKLKCSHPLGNVQHHSRPKRLVAAFHQRDPKANLVQHQSERAAALASAPAVGERLPVFGPVNHLTLNVLRDIACRNRRTAFFGLKRVDLLVGSADKNSLPVI